MTELVEDAGVLDGLAELVREANQGRSHWTCVKRFRVVPDTVSIDNGLLTPTLKIKRNRVRERFEQEIESMYTLNEIKPPVVALELPHESEHANAERGGHAA